MWARKKNPQQKSTLSISHLTYSPAYSFLPSSFSLFHRWTNDDDNNDNAIIIKNIKGHFHVKYSSCFSTMQVGDVHTQLVNWNCAFFISSWSFFFILFYSFFITVQREQQQQQNREWKNRKNWLAIAFQCRQIMLSKDAKVFTSDVSLAVW